jgi:GntR family transcriptional regulator
VQVANDIAARIAVGEFTRRLPGERDLAREYKVAYQTVRHGIGLLRTRGLVITRHGRGTFIAPPERPDPPGCQRVAGLEQGIAAHAQAPVQLTAAPRQPCQRRIRPVSILVLAPGRNESHGHRLGLQVFSQEPEDHEAVAVSCHHDTPGNTSNSGQRRKQGLNNKRVP